MGEEHIFKAFESIGIPKMQTLIYLDLLRNKESFNTDIYDTRVLGKKSQRTIG